MNNFFRKILIKITGIGWCGTPWIQMEKASRIESLNKEELEKEQE